jgi:hypothetical protein
VVLYFDSEDLFYVGQDFFLRQKEQALELAVHLAHFLCYQQISVQ